MHTIYFWQHTNLITGRCIRTRHRLSEADARKQLFDADRVEWGAIETAETLQLVPGDLWASGVVRCEDGAMLPAPFAP